MTASWWARHPRWGTMVVVLIGAAGEFTVIALLVWYWRPKCPVCGKRMVRT